MTASITRKLIIVAFLLAAWTMGFACCALIAQGQELQIKGLLANATPTAGEIELGRQLFFDPRLSVDNTVACSTCHDPRKGWSDGRPQAVGILNQRGTRNTPTILNATYADLQFWDGRTVGLSTQAGLPMLNPIEMGQPSEAAIVAKVSLIPGYVVNFTKVYGLDAQGRSVTMINMSRALAAFESMIISAQDAPIDKRLKGDTKALGPDAEIGYQIFTRANCMECHAPPLFSDLKFHNTGLEYATRGRTTDRGRAEFTNAAADVGAFKTPSLREIGRTAPYGHNGEIADLKRMVRHYNLAGYVIPQGDTRLFRDGRIDPRIKNLELTETQENYLVKFLDEAFRSPNYPAVEGGKLP